MSGEANKKSIEKYERQATIYQCKCGDKFLSEKALREHRAANTYRGCPDCDFTGDSRAVDAHMASKHKKNGSTRVIISCDEPQ